MAARLQHRALRAGGVYVSSERPSRHRREGREDITASATAATKAAAKTTAAIVSTATTSAVPKSKSSAIPSAPAGRAAEVPIAMGVVGDGADSVGIDMMPYWSNGVIDRQSQSGNGYYYLPLGEGDARPRRELQRRDFAAGGGGLRALCNALPEALDPLGQRLRTPAERRVHRRFESEQRLVAGYDVFGQGVLGEVGAQARHGVGESAHVDADERALLCPGQVFFTALHPSHLPCSAAAAFSPPLPARQRGERLIWLERPVTARPRRGWKLSRTAVEDRAGSWDAVQAGAALTRLPGEPEA